MWIVEVLTANNKVAFAAGNDRERLCAALRVKGALAIGIPVRLDLIGQFPKLTSRVEALGFDTIS